MEQKGYNKNWKKSDKKPVVYKPKRGKLAPLMTEEAKSTAGIHELSYDFGCITPLYVYRMWGGSASLEEIERAMEDVRRMM